LKAKCPEEFSEAHKIYMDGKVRHTGQIGVKPVPRQEPAVPLDKFPIELRRQMLAFLREYTSDPEGNGD
jgi:hypothetical protein